MWSRMYLTQPVATSERWMNASRLLYSSSVTKAPKFRIEVTVPTTSSPRSLAWPPVGVARVAPQTEQFTTVAGRLKIVCSVEQSGHFTTQKGDGARIRPPLVVLHELELARAPARRLHGILALLASVLQVDAPDRFRAALGLRSRKTSVPA